MTGIREGKGGGISDKNAGGSSGPGREERQVAVDPASVRSERERTGRHGARAGDPGFTVQASIGV